MFFTQELLSRRDSGFGLLWYVCAPRTHIVQGTPVLVPFFLTLHRSQACRHAWSKVVFQETP